jgi:glucokinase
MERFMKQYSYYMGFDVGGTKFAVSVGRVDENGVTVVERQEVPTMSEPKDTLERFANYISTWKDRYKIRFAGISCGGPLDSNTGVIISTPNLPKPWHGFPIVQYVREKFGLESALENDANACAVAEWRFGAGRGTKNMIFMTFGTGLGAGLILDGKLYSGTNGNAGEVGHLRLAKSGPVGYNKVGSAEGFCSGNGIRNLALLRAKEQGVELPESITTKEIFARTYNGDKFCESIVRESSERFGEVVSLLIDLFNPEVVTAGGVFMRNYDLIMRYALPIIEGEALGESRSVCKILPAEIGENVGDFAAIAIAVGLDGRD